MSYLTYDPATSKYPIRGFSNPNRVTSPNAIPSTISLNFVTPGDTNGIVYYIGTNEGTTGFTNPAGSGVLTTNSGAYSGVYEGTNTTDRDSATFWQSPAGTNQWISYRFVNKSFSPNKITLRYRSSSHLLSTYFNPFKLQYSEDGTNWIDIETYTPGENEWEVFDVITAIAAERFRLICTSLSSQFRIIAEVEFYGNILI